MKKMTEQEEQNNRNCARKEWESLAQGSKVTIFTTYLGQVATRCCRSSNQQTCIFVHQQMAHMLTNQNFNFLAVC